MQFTKDLLSDYAKSYFVAKSHYKSLPLHFVAATLFMLFVAGLDTLVPYLLRAATNELSGDNRSAAFMAVVLAAAYGLCWTSARVFEWIKSLVSAVMLARCDAAFQQTFYSHLIRVEYDRLMSVDAGAMLTTVDRSRSAFSNITFTLFWVVIPIVFQLCLASAVLWRVTEGSFALAFAISMITLFAVTWSLASKSKTAHSDIFDADNTLASHLIEKLAFTLDLKLNGAYRREDAALSHILNGYVSKVSKANARMTLLMAGQSLCTGIVLTAFTVITATKVADASFRIGDFVMIVGYIMALTAPFSTLSATLSDLRRNHLALREGFDILAMPLESGAPHAAFDKTAPIVCSIDQVDLALGTRTILNDVSLRVERNTLTVLVGPSGSGKSSLVYLMLGLIRPRRGQVRLLGTDIKDVAVSAIAREIAVAPQNPLIVSGTLRDNLVYGCDAAPDDSFLRELVDELELAELGKGGSGDVLDQPLGIQGRELSGGERQRVALGRALARRPSILILDEPTSSIDPERETRIVRRLRSRVPTIIATTHREALMQAADCVYEIGNERVTCVYTACS